MPEEQFPDTKPWPKDELEGPNRHHNEPPLEERIPLQFEEAVYHRGLATRIADIRASAAKAPAIDSDLAAGKIGDLFNLARAAREAIEEEREKLNRPLLNAQRTLKARAESFLLPMDTSLAELRERLDAYVDGRAAGGEPLKIRGDYGAKVGAIANRRFEVLDYGKLPLAIRKHPSVAEALDKLVAKEVRGGAEKISGVKIWSEVKASVR